MSHRNRALRAAHWHRLRALAAAGRAMQEGAQTAAQGHFADAGFMWLQVKKLLNTPAIQ